MPHHHPQRSSTSAVHASEEPQMSRFRQERVPGLEREGTHKTRIAGFPSRSCKTATDSKSVLPAALTRASVWILKVSLPKKILAHHP